MSDTRHVKPAEGLRVPDHQRGGYLPAEGRPVKWDLRWARWLREGSIVVGDAPKTKTKTTKARKED